MSTSARIPVPHLHARRRKSGSTAWLIRDNRYFELDPLVDALFLACDGVQTVEQITGSLKARGLLEGDDACEVAASALDDLSALGLVQWR